jgi:hypothetical protein
MWQSVGPMRAASQRMAGSPQWQQAIVDSYGKMPEFVRSDLLEGLLIGSGIAIPVAMMPNQDPHEQAAAILGGIGGATFGGAGSKYIGAALGGSQPLQPGSYRYNLGRMMGRKEMLSSVTDMLGVEAVPQITGKEFGRAVGRVVGDEVFGVAGTLGALAAAQAMDSTPDEVAGPSTGQLVAGTVPGALLGLATSGVAGGMVDMVGLNRAMAESPDGFSMDTIRQHSIFRKANGGAP